MKLRKWEELPEYMQTKELKPYYDRLQKKKKSLIVKRSLDIVISGLFLIVLSPLFLIIAIIIKLDSDGPVFFRQERVTAYGKTFKIFKFRTMVDKAESKGPHVTVENDSRITRVGKVIRKIRVDEFAQLIDIFVGNMTFVGTRPEVPKYVNAYTNEMYATLLLPAGLTNDASLYYADEAEKIANAEDADKTYIETLLPEKMKYNLYDIKHMSLKNDIKIVLKTALVVFGKKYEAKEFEKNMK